MYIEKFFQDSEGNWAIVQKPNLLITVWAVLTLLNFIFFRFDHQGYDMVTSMILFTWAYLEFSQGSSGFRQLLGGVIMFAITLSAVTH